MNLRYPNITNAPPSEQLAQIKSYLYQLVEQLNTEKENAAAEERQITVQNNSAVSDRTEQTRSPESTFNQIKSLIIKSADIVDSFYTQMSEKFEGHQR